jgi:alkanesulfonate monooxygenase SsuD/methylene tetrahydromethanopterin reductase-like flavin-dependent oxidoreductase (luciferase family)
MKSWVGVGGSQESVIRAAKYDFPLMLAIIGGSPTRFTSFVDQYHNARKQFNLPVGEVAIHCPGHIAETDEKAKETVWPHLQKMYAKIGRERGWPPMRYDQFQFGTSPDGAMFVGSPETVARKIVDVTNHLGVDRFDMKYSNGTMPHEDCMDSIKLFATEVIPRVRELREE